MFEYFGWLYLNLKWRISDWWARKTETEPSSVDVQIYSPTIRARYNYNNYN